MTLVLQDVNTEEDFPAIARCMFESYENPHQPLIQIWFPIHGNDHEAREDAIREAADRLKRWHAQDATSHWHKIVDESGKIVGGALWSIHKDNPFANHKPPEAPWFPADGSREYAEEVLRIHVEPRSRHARGPHVCKCPDFPHVAHFFRPENPHPAYKTEQTYLSSSRILNTAVEELASR
jgi:hypothetical protein